MTARPTSPRQPCQGDTARQDYTQHVIRGACCTGGRLCSTGRILVRSAWGEQARREYVETAEMFAGHYLMPIAHTLGGSCTVCAWLGRALDALSISLDLAVAVECEKRTANRGQGD